MQTELFLEDLAEKIEENDASNLQTDDFIDRPSAPLFVPEKIDTDADIQILPTELFDFDIEVRPILEVLVCNTCKQAIIEVCKEEELVTLQAQQRRFQQRRFPKITQGLQIKIKNLLKPPQTSIGNDITCLSEDQKIKFNEWVSDEFIDIIHKIKTLINKNMIADRSWKSWRNFR